MKEAFWGVLIVVLGLFGIVIINIFQKVTIVNDEVYYLLKETTEAAGYDAIDLSYYRLKGEIRIVEDKFVENLVRRFAGNLTNNGVYKITVQELNEVPPRMTVKIQTSITSIQGEMFGISNKIDSIIETKYDLKEVLDFLGITEEEWRNKSNVNKGVENGCEITTYGSGEKECITGDIEFTGWEEDNIPETSCSTDETIKSKREARYRVCECGKWKEEVEEIEAKVTKSSKEDIYTWTIKKEGEIRGIEETTKKRVYYEKCTTGIEIYVPKDLRETEPSSDNSKYEKCPIEGTTVNQGSTIILHANYIPADSSNRKVVWTNSDSSKLTLQSSNPYTDEGYSKAGITGKELGETTITAKTTNGHTATCKVKVLDGHVDTIGCKDKTITEGDSSTMESTYTPYTANKTNFVWSSEGEITIIDNDGKVIGIKEGTSTITIMAPNGKTGACTVTVKKKSSSGSSSSSGSAETCDKITWQVNHCNGSITRSVCLEYAKINVTEKIEVCMPVPTYVYYTCGETCYCRQYGYTTTLKYVCLARRCDPKICSKTIGTKQTCYKQTVTSTKKGDCIKWKQDIKNDRTYTGNVIDDCITKTYSSCA